MLKLKELTKPVTLEIFEDFAFFILSNLSSLFLFVFVLSFFVLCFSFFFFPFLFLPFSPLFFGHLKRKNRRKHPTVKNDDFPFWKVDFWATVDRNS